MSYLFQNLDGKVKKAVESSGVTGHSNPAALKKLQLTCRTRWKVLMQLLDRQALRDYYYQVKARTPWCNNVRQSAIIQTLEYLSRATM